MQEDARELDAPLRLTTADPPLETAVHTNDCVQSGKRGRVIQRHGKDQVRFDGGEGACTFIPELAWANRVQQRNERAPDILIRERDGDRAIEVSGPN